MGSPDESDERFAQAWGDSPRLTPRQARAITAALELWCGEIEEWCAGEDRRRPLHTVALFSDVDIRVMMLVADNPAWAAAAAERCDAVSDEIEAGVLPFDREGCFFDELLMGAALQTAPGLLEDLDGLYDDIPVREVPPDADEENYNGPMLGDTEWDLVSSNFNDASRWDEWEVPVMPGHPALPAVLMAHHPFRWFDPGPGTGPGYLLRLSV